MTLYELLDNYYELTKNKSKYRDGGVLALHARLESDWASTLPRTATLTVVGWEPSGGPLGSGATQIDRPVGRADIDRVTGQIKRIYPDPNARLDDWNNVQKAHTKEAVA